jgi:hypothetical protein
MGTDNTKQLANGADATAFLGEDWFDPLEAAVRGVAILLPQQKPLLRVSVPDQSCARL